MTYGRAWIAASLVLATHAVVGCGSSGKKDPPLPPTYTVTYDANGSTGGSVPLDATGYTQGATVTVLGNPGTLVKSGYTFEGWCVNADGSGSCFVDGLTFSIGGENEVLYAKWLLIPTYTVTYDGNANTGGTVPTDGASYAAGGTVTVLGNPGSLVKTGATFGGWCVNADGTGFCFLEGQPLVMGGGSEILYAKWVPNPTYSVIYLGNGNTGGAVPTDGAAYEAGATVTVLGNTGGLVKAGFTFIGWSVSTDGTGDSFTAGQTFTMGGANKSLYAKWTSNPTFTVTYDGNASTGGTVPVDGNNYEQGAAVTVLGNTGDLVTDQVRDGVTLVFNGWRYLEAAPADQGVDRQWYSGLTPPPVTTGTAVGTGQANTAAVIAVQGLPGLGEVAYAALICDELVLGGFSDWFLPSKDELNLMYVNLKVAGVGGFAAAGYWSSSEFESDSLMARNQYFVTGGQGYDPKYWNNNVRAIRAF
jgi:uncharacterized repeat protein (TIGR02543 family)